MELGEEEEGANLEGFLPSPHIATSRSFTALTRTSVSSAVNCS